MSQSGYTPIQLYHSTSAGVQPTAGNLADGELAINITDGKLYYKDGSTVKLLASNSGASGDVVGPASATDSALAAFDGTTGKLIKQASTVTTAQGGTGLTSFTSGGAVYATSTSALTTGTLPVASGGTGAATLTANNVLLGNGTSALQVVAPGASGNVLTSNGTTWTSSTPAASGATKGQAIAFSMLFGF